MSSQIGLSTVLETDAFLLAILTGLAMGVLTAMVGSSWQRLAIMLTMLYVLQTGAQQLLRVFAGTGTGDEFITITIYRVVFAVAACLVVALTDRWTHRREEDA